MPLSLRWGSVTAVTDRQPELVRLEVDGAPCVAYPRLTGDVEVGDTVIVNTQARDLELGSGGFDLLYANLTRGLGLAPTDGAHVMALPYAPGQMALRFGEETDQLAYDLEDLPVVCCSLHSQLAPVCAGLGGGAVAYVQLGGGALPVSLSDAVRALKRRDLLQVAIAAAPCFDGDVQCATPAAALAWAAASGADAVVCGLGPGIVGTGSALGHGGLAVTEAANAAHALAGRAIVAPRISLADPRERHQGLSHHTRAALALCLAPVLVAWPLGLPPPEDLDAEVVVVDVHGWEAVCEGLPLEHMGRGPADDPWFFMAAYAAGRLARWEVLEP
jgi:hypothetical protein